MRTARPASLPISPRHVTCGLGVMFQLWAATAMAAAGPAVDSESLIGRDRQTLEATLGVPTGRDEAAHGSERWRYIWVHITDATGKVLFDERGFPPEALMAGDHQVMKCEREFTLHASGLVLDALDTGQCTAPALVPESRAYYERQALTGTRAAQRWDGPDARGRLALNLMFYFAADDQAGFDRYLEILDPSALTLNDGGSALGQVLGNMFETLLGHSKWLDYEAQLTRWQQSDPQSVGTALLRASYWNAYAWYARGTGTTDTVSPEGADLFKQRIARALSELQASAPVASSHPLWHELRLQLMLYHGDRKQDIEAAMNESVAKFPTYLPLRFQMLGALQPQWGGSIQAMDAFIVRQVEQAPPDERQELYARLYWSMHGWLSGQASIFAVSSVDWPKMAQGFRVMLKRHPASMWNRQNFAALACAANDGETYREIRPGLDAFIHPDAWSPPFNLEACDHRLLRAL